MNEQKQTTQPVYVTKWALTAGIMKFKPGQGHTWSSDGGQVYFSAKWGNGNGIFVGKKDWTYSLDEAKERVKALVQCKLKSIAKQAKRLESFEPKLIEPVPVREQS